MWKSKRQSFVALSTAEAEFINLTPTGRALLWINCLVQALQGSRYPQISQRPLLLMTDSENARTHALNPLNTARTRQIDLRYKWIIEKVSQERAFDLRHVTTDLMPADGLTKPLAITKLQEFIRQLNMTYVPLKGGISVALSKRGHRDRGYHDRMTRGG